VQSLAEILTAAAGGDFPAADGSVRVVAQPSPRDAGVVAFTAHAVVFVDLADPAWVHATLAGLGCDPLAAAMHPRFLTALLEHTGRTTDTIDLLTVAAARPGPPPLLLREIADPDHPRVRRARARRDDVRVWAADGGVLVLGRGVAGRWEAAVEVDEPLRHHGRAAAPFPQGPAAAPPRGLGRALAAAARHLVPDGGPVWAQQAAGNARSIRAFQAAGFRPVAAEALLLPPA
jgi:hypothetical protein